MCGRFTLTSNLAEIASRFSAKAIISDWQPRYNIAPGQLALAVTQESQEKALEWMHFGFIPHWAKEKNVGYTMINARAETISQKPSFRISFRSKRCLIPADGYYEWQETPQGKQPYRITLKSGKLFAFAAIWDSWKDEQGKFLHSFAIATTQANFLTQTLHDRMPVILQQENESKWLDPAVTDANDLESLLTPYPSQDLTIYPTSKLVNSWKNDTPDCLLPSQNV
jgi:putative SOS response-associated peptidase YedK